ncbi:GntR family transcriptional regulator [Chitinophaga caeni]|uniref:GntR family transcriptional regulator n=1 Tax=Chitinophaga caeni TaxID=2029983 RepID=A0A291R0I0_9BACT|nr:PLP-dependent aminotransferase family protein [Chitinophaga caeni]ATL49707.1 GntR family transcriptional regulator [Chitinophaga caeni]
MHKIFKYLEIANAISQKIKDGVFLPGDKLPSIRTVVKEYGVSMNTATQSFMELERRNLVESRPQSGFYVKVQIRRQFDEPGISNPSLKPGFADAADLIDEVYASLNQPGITRFSLGVPDPSFLPVAKLNKCLLEASRKMPDSGTSYEDIQGNKKLRNNIARWSFTWGSQLVADDLVSTSGAMNAIAYCLLATMEKGDTLAVESPVYFGILQLAQSLGIRVLELPTHPGTGIELGALKKVIGKINACLLVSNFNNPLGSCMPESHKMAVVNMLGEQGIPLIENDLYGDIYFGNARPKPCKAFDQGGTVLWCGSVSKTLAPGYRVGWVAPGKYLRKITRLKLHHTVTNTGIIHEAVGNFIGSDNYEKHLRNLRKELYYNNLQISKTVSASFPQGSQLVPPQGGYAMWIALPGKINTADLYHACMRENISIAPGRMFSLQDQFNNCLRLNIGMKWTPELEQKLIRVGHLAQTLL